MDVPTTLRRLRAEMERELTDGILPYWAHHTVDTQRGGFLGRVTHDNRGVADAPKGGILNARILWTFSAAYRHLGEKQHRKLADRAYRYLTEHFWDSEHGGIYWMLDADGRPADVRKHIYAQAFAVYGFSEYYRATGTEAALHRATTLYRLIETHGADDAHGGYYEAFDRAWNRMDDARLSEKDLDAPKSMNTHLHILEAYTTLYRAGPDPDLRERLRALVELFHTTIVQDGHCVTFFEADWTPMADEVSYGHDIEASWLLLEAADVLEDDVVRGKARETCLALARATLREGVDDDGGLLYEGGPDGLRDGDKHWWPQAEAVVGFLNAYQETEDADFLEAAVGAWRFTQQHVIDDTQGGWHERVARDGTPYVEDKVRPWKCPYHNARACLEVMTRTEARRTGTATTQHVTEAASVDDE